MISFTSHRDNSTVFDQIEHLDDGMKRAVRHMWFALAKDLRAEARREILRKPKSGRTYIVRTKKGRRRKHVASAPGETHANLSGEFTDIIVWNLVMV